LPTVLLIDDNKDILQYLVACLGDDYKVDTAKDGQEGIDKSIEIVPDVIVCDVMMPVKDGFEVVDTLKNDERTSHIPIILLTAKADSESRISGLRRGADAYLTKPFNEEELMIRLANFANNRKKIQAHFQKGTPLSAEEAKEIRQEDEFLQKIRQTLEARIDEEDFGIIRYLQSHWDEPGSAAP
jgi:DNA-binding response OmpR family regulator